MFFTTRFHRLPGYSLFFSLSLTALGQCIKIIKMLIYTVVVLAFDGEGGQRIIIYGRLHVMEVSIAE